MFYEQLLKLKNATLGCVENNEKMQKKNSFLLIYLSLTMVAIIKIDVALQIVLYNILHLGLFLVLHCSI